MQESSNELIPMPQDFTRHRCLMMDKIVQGIGRLA